MTLPAIAGKFPTLLQGKRITCITTAAAPYKEKPWVLAEQDKLRSLGAKVTDIDLSSFSRADVKDRLNDSDGIFVHGGNTFYLLQEMQRSHFEEFIREYLLTGRPYIGSSAGSIVAGSRIDVISATDDPALAPNVKAESGLRLINLVPMVHFDDPKYAAAFRQAFDRAIATGVNILPLRNDQFAVIHNGLFEVVTTGVIVDELNGSVK